MTRGSACRMLLGYGPYGLLVIWASHFFVYKRLGSDQLTFAEFCFILPGILLIANLYGPHSGGGFFPASVISNSFMYLVMPLMAAEVVRRAWRGRLGWRDLSRFLLLFALWVALTYPRERNCFSPWDGLEYFRLGFRDWGLSVIGESVEGLVVVAAACLGADLLAAWLLRAREGGCSTQAGRRTWQVSWAMALVLVGAWGLFGIIHCWARSYLE